MGSLTMEKEEELIAEFEEAARNASSLQARLLNSILAHNTSCLYLQPYFSDGFSDSLAFLSRVPVVNYDDMRSWIERIADENSDGVLTMAPITSLVLSSGTSGGRPRMIPSTNDLRQITSKRFSLSNALIKRDLPLDCVGKSLCFIYAGKLFPTKSGLKAGSASTHHLRSGALLNNLPQWTSPMAVVLGPDIQESMYCHLLCGLLQATEVTVVSSFLAYGITEAFRFFEGVWEELSNDIRVGTLSDRVKCEHIRCDVLKHIRSDRKLAEKVRSECERGCWSGIIQRLWPNAKYIHTIVTGTMEPYVPYLKGYAGDLPIVCGDYGSSECTVGINLRPMTPPEHVIFTLVPFSAYFEFLPFHMDGKEEPVDITGVEVSKEYEVIVTTVAGLYRYRLGDIIKITGFYHELPQFSFVRRKDVVLSINTDKTDERELCDVITRASVLLKEGNMHLLDFTSHADHSSRPGHYTIFWELKEDTGIEDSILEKCCKNMDSSFNDPYQRGRWAGTIGPLELCIVKQATFQTLMLYNLEFGVSPTQYKTPRSVNSSELLRILRQSVVRVFASS